MSDSQGSTRAATILIVDDSADVLAGLGVILRQRYANVIQASSGEQALRIMANIEADVVITDVSMPGIDGLELLGQVKENWPRTLVVLITGFGSIQTAVEAIKRGAFHYVAKPCQPEEMLMIVDHALQQLSLEREVEDLRRKLSEGEPFSGIIARSKKMHDVFEFIRKVAPTDAPVLIRGESGTGKELVARAIHKESRRESQRFLGINAAALPEQLLEAELFGYKKGAFTGAYQAKAGLLSSARGGTVFLDEISRMPLSCQAKLLRAVEEKEVLPVGGLEIQQIDVRFVSATNADDLKDIRDDLYYRLSVMEIHVPPLRERMEDVALLAAHFVEKYALQFDREPVRLSPNSLEVLMSYDWPGNVRELENVLQRAVVICPRDQINAEDVRIKSEGAAAEPSPTGSLPSYSQAKDQVLKTFQRRYVGTLLERTGGNVSSASRLAGVTRAAFYAIMKRNGFTKERDWKRQ